jgi:predicted 3-demethylubiquinone-9 3-methyltransferase (glyoxalase superfamily)
MCRFINTSDYRVYNLIMQKITPHLWFDTEAVEAMEFYMSVFPNGAVTFKTQIKNTPSGDCDIVGFTLMGFAFQAISAGPYFKINPAISFHVKCHTVDVVREIWHKLLPGGKALMELGEYPFSQQYGWIEDKFGVSWQLIYTEDKTAEQITPALMFTQAVSGRAEEAGSFYASIFPRSALQVMARYRKDEAPELSGTVKYAQLILCDQEFGVMDSAQAHDFTFSEGVSLIISCKDQEEIDYFWDMLSAVPEAEQCGWVKDRFGVSWQILPENLAVMMEKNPEKTAPALLQMKKIIISDLIKAAEL